MPEISRALGRGDARQALRLLRRLVGDERVAVACLWHLVDATSPSPSTALSRDLLR